MKRNKGHRTQLYLHCERTFDKRKKNIMPLQTLSRTALHVLMRSLVINVF